jgi:hypothetical protein
MLLGLKPEKILCKSIEMIWDANMSQGFLKLIPIGKIIELG